MPWPVWAALTKSPYMQRLKTSSRLLLTSLEAGTASQSTATVGLWAADRAPPGPFARTLTPVVT